MVGVVDGRRRAAALARAVVVAAVAPEGSTHFLTSCRGPEKVDRPAGVNRVYELRKNNLFLSVVVAKVVAVVVGANDG